MQDYRFAMSSMFSDSDLPHRILILSFDMEVTMTNDMVWQLGITVSVPGLSFMRCIDVPGAFPKGAMSRAPGCSTWMATAAYDAIKVTAKEAYTDMSEWSTHAMAMAGTDVSSTYLVAHNGFAHDFMYFKRDLETLGLPIPDVMISDTILVTKATMPGMSFYSLTDEMGVRYTRHSAMGDSTALMSLLGKSDESRAALMGLSCRYYAYVDAINR